MVKNLKKKQTSSWSDIILHPGSGTSHRDPSGSTSDLNALTDLVAGYLFEEINRRKDLFDSPFISGKKFSRLKESELNVVVEYASYIPLKLKLHNLFIRPFRNFCRTCIITDPEILMHAQSDHDMYCREQVSQGWVSGRTYDIEKKTDPFLLPFGKLPEKRKNFYLELNFLIPRLLKKSGFEIVRPEEVAALDETLVMELARAIHSRYLGEVRKQNFFRNSELPGVITGKGGEWPEKHLMEFDGLPDDIKFSNVDNAYHIPTKLLSIGYRIKPLAKGYKPVALRLDSSEIETMAVVEHLRWCWDKRLNGWNYGKNKNDKKKRHPGLVPYDQLSESEKEKDRELVRLIPALLKDINYEALPVSPERFRKLSYAIKPHSSVHRILDETRQLNDQLRKMVKLSPAMVEMISLRNQKIEDAIAEVEGSYNYAKHIQQAFLPDDLFIRECMPKNFVLYLPKDIVSGDFYFFSKYEHLVIFAAADCTGHGIPGALLSTIGYGILDQAVNELKLKDPRNILNHLYSKLHGFLNREKIRSGTSDDMDIILCTLDLDTNILTYSGVCNPLYHITGGELNEYKAKNFGRRSNVTAEESFVSEEIKVRSGDSIYLCSDGYSDQFGGKHHKKYQRERFKKFLVSIQEYSMPEQGDLLYEEIERWRGENNEDQTDDILVIGVRI